MGARRNTAGPAPERLAALGVAAAALALAVDPALAASDTTFSGPLDTVTDMVSGTGGQLAAALAVGAALVGSTTSCARAWSATAPCMAPPWWASGWSRRATPTRRRALP